MHVHKMNFLLNLFTILFIIYGSDGYRILAIFPYNSRSHNNVLEGVTRSLAKRGHQVDAISHFNMTNPPKNYKTIINLNGTIMTVVNNFTMEMATKLRLEFVTVLSEKFGNEICELLGLKEIQNLIKNPPDDPPYDVLIVESFTAHCFFGIGYILKIPLITVVASLEFSWTSAAVGNPDSIAIAPNVLMNSAEVSTFWKRLENAIMSYHSKYIFFSMTDDIQTKQMRKYLSPDMPNIREIEKMTALTFANSHFSFSGIRVRNPALIDIAGIHLEDVPVIISKELDDWLDDSKEGVVYFSLGSLMVIESLPKEILLALLSSFKKIAPIRILMKIVNKEKLPAELPENVFTSKWIPQLQVLKHKNTRLFITHGGLMSTLEALYYCVPLIGIPLFSDQFFNIRTLVKKNVAVLLNLDDITEDNLDTTLNHVLNNSTYRESAKLESRLFHDRPMNATETVNFWVEYVVRNGPDSLKSPSVDLYWWQQSLLDVYGFLFLSTFIVIYLHLMFFKFLWRFYT